MKDKIRNNKVLIKGLEKKAVISDQFLSQTLRLYLFYVARSDTPHHTPNYEKIPTSNIIDGMSFWLWRGLLLRSKNLSHIYCICHVCLQIHFWCFPLTVNSPWPGTSTSFLKLSPFAQLSSQGKHTSSTKLSVQKNFPSSEILFPSYKRILVLIFSNKVETGMNN